MQSKRETGPQLRNGNDESTFGADAHRDDGKRFVMRADEKLTAFVGSGVGDSRPRLFALTGRRNFLQTGWF